MKKELIICIIVIAIVVVGNIITQNNTNQCVSEMNGQLYELKEELKREVIQQNKNEEKINTKIEKIRTRWDEMQESLAFYIEHDELEKVETQIFLLKGDIEAKVYDDTFAEIEKCIFILEHIADKNALDIKNVF